MSEAYKIASETAQWSAQHGKKLYDKKVHRIVLEPGVRVLVWNMSERGGPIKLRWYWENEVYVAVEQKDQNTLVYKVWSKSGTKTTVLHCNLLLHVPCADLPVEKADVRHRDNNNDSSKITNLRTTVELNYIYSQSGWQWRRHPILHTWRTAGQASKLHCWTPRNRRLKYTGFCDYWQYSWPLTRSRTWTTCHWLVERIHTWYRTQAVPIFYFSTCWYLTAMKTTCPCDIWCLWQAFILSRSNL